MRRTVITLTPRMPAASATVACWYVTSCSVMVPAIIGAVAWPARAPGGAGVGEVVQRCTGTGGHSWHARCHRRWGHLTTPSRFGASKRCHDRGGHHAHIALDGYA